MPYKPALTPVHFHGDFGRHTIELTRNEAKESDRLLQLVNDMKHPKLTDAERDQLFKSAKRQADVWVQTKASSNVAADLEAFSRRAQVRLLLGLWRRSNE